MDRSRMMIGLAISVFAGLLLSIFVYHEFKIASAPIPLPAKEEIVVAAGPLPLGTRLTSKDLRIVPWPSGEAPLANTFRRMEDAENRALITSVVENEPILESKLAPVAAGAGLAATIPEGMRALSVAVNDVVSVAGFVTPGGAMVDVIATGATSGNGNITRTVLENVRVLAANQRVESGSGKPVSVTVITLLVTPPDAATLAMAASSGKIQLALRNTIDSQTMEIPPVLQASLFGMEPTPVPEKHVSAPAKQAAPPPPPSYTVDVISGGKRESKSFPSPEQSTGESNGQPAQSH
jgi:pilus assembly protein CpaB